MTTEFSELGLQPQLVQAVTERGYTTPTPIQTAVIPLMLSGQDVIGQAQTGTGKTAAFSLPILNGLIPGLNQVQALVLAPTRELALQVARSVYEYGQHSDMHVLAVYGGAPYSRQIGRLKRGVDIVVGTPGRLIDLMKQKVLDLSHVRTVVLDEADEMLSMGFIEDIETILEATPNTRQTTLFSATMPPPIRQLAQKYMRNPQAITIEHKQRTVEAIDQRYILVNEEDKTAALTRIFEVEEIHSALIFARTRMGTGELANELTVRGFPAESLNGDLSQDARERVLNRFRQNQIKVLVATDVAARGLDIDDISHVFNFDLPNDSESYVHRVGRTGRAGKTGVAISLVTPREKFRLGRIEKYIKHKLTRVQLPSVEDIQAFREKQLVEMMLVWLKRGRCRREKELVETLAAEGYDPVEVAAAALKMARAEEKQRPIYPVSEVVEKTNNRRERPSRANNNGNQANNGSRRANNNGSGSSRSSHESGMVRLVMNVGKAQGIRPNDVVGTIAYHADIPGRAIGAIHIQAQHTLVDIPQELVSQVLASDSYKIRKTAVSITTA
ncbi:MAG: DEAD/DEAH box helicase [Ardenticatenaceae bacterium]|nr:DEAD/DEAH box helicase [Ardenticatenaceae bacterium]